MPDCWPLFFLAASAKLFVPKEKLAGMSASSRWVEDFSPGALKAIGALELLAAVGLILPAALDIAPVHTSLGTGAGLEQAWNLTGGPVTHDLAVMDCEDLPVTHV